MMLHHQMSSYQHFKRMQCLHFLGQAVQEEFFSDTYIAVRLKSQTEGLSVKVTPNEALD
jgi:hypothetical protein